MALHTLGIKFLVIRHVSHPGSNPIKEISLKKFQISLKFANGALPQFRSNYRIVTIGIEVMYHQKILRLNLSVLRLNFFHRIDSKSQGQFSQMSTCVCFSIFQMNNFQSCTICISNSHTHTHTHILIRS